MKISSSKLSSQLIRKILGYFVITTILVTGLQLLYEYHSTKKIIDQEVKKIALNSNVSLANALWTYNHKLLESVVEGINNYDVVSGIRIIDNTQLMNFGKTQKSNEEGIKFPINYMGADGFERRIGVFILFKNEQIMTDRLVKGFTVVLVNSIVQVIFLFGLFLFYIRNLIDVPLTKITNFINNFDINSAKYELIDLDSHVDNEFITLESILNSLIIKLKEKNTKLLNVNEKLEDEVLARTAELERAIITAQDASKAKSMFLANMSHEIRTPMNGIIGTVSLLKELENSKEQNELIIDLSSSSEMLMSLINDVLDYAKIESGQLLISKETLLLENLVKDVLKIVQTKTKLSIDISYRFLNETLKSPIYSDSLRIKQVLMNLLSNAIKFTHKGSVTVELDLVEFNKTKFIQVDVIDTGIGIRDEDQERIFETFSQADSSTTRKYGGTGLGLAICKKICHLMEGDVFIFKSDEEGSIFRIELPFIPSNEKIEKVIESDVIPVFDQLKVLVVEDNVMNQKIIKKLLNKLSIEPDIVNNGRESLDILAENSYDVILMDIQMPVMDGVTATKEILKMSDITTPKIIALTANAFAEDKERCLAAGMDEYLTKPIDLASLVKVLSKI